MIGCCDRVETDRMPQKYSVSASSSNAFEFAATLPADVEQHIGGEEFDHHLPGASGIPRVLLPRRQPVRLEHRSRDRPDILGTACFETARTSIRRLFFAVRRQQSHGGVESKARCKPDDRETIKNGTSPTRIQSD